MAATTRTDYVKFLKELYKGSVVADLCYDENAVFALIPKNPNTGGNKYIKPIRFAWGTGRGATYSTVNANIGPAKRARWEMDWTDHYVKAAVENKAIELAEGAGNAGAFKSLLVDETDWAYQAFSNDVEVELHQDGTGYRGAATGAYGAVLAGYVQLAEGEGVNFNVGDIIQKFDVSGSTLPAETRVITAVDRDNDRIAFASDFTVPTAAPDYFILEGDSTKAFGLKAWLPGASGIAAGGGTAPNVLNSVDRSPDPARLAGVDGITGTLSGLLITDSLVQTCAKINKNGGRPNLALLSPEDFADFALETENRGRYAKVSATTGSVSFSALEVQTGSGAVPVVADRHTSSQQAFILDTRTHELYSTNGLPSMFKRDGSMYHRTEDKDEISFYMYGFYGLSNQYPGRSSWVQTLY